MIQSSDPSGKSTFIR